MKETKKFISLEEALKKGNDGKNQEIKRKFIEREVYCNVGTLVEYCLNQSHEDSESPVTFDEVENYYSYPEYRGRFADFSGGSEEERQEEIDRLNELIEETASGATIAHIEDEVRELENLETEPREVYEWWAVSPFLYDKLKENGCVVVDTGSCKVWGRCTTGQAILLDYVITRICADMGILENQENAWL